MLVSIIVRTLNEAKYLQDLLTSIKKQITKDLSIEIVLVDSGSVDNTLDIAKSFACKVIHISREEFSFGRSLNMGCEAASGEILVMISGHCVPLDDRWLQYLCQPLLDKDVVYVYGRQIGGAKSRFSECRLFAKYYPAYSQIPQEGFYCNNANSAIKKSAWENYRFDEDLTGLEDMELAKRLAGDDCKIGYVAEACVYHYHEENWRKVKRRFEREAIALQKIMPQVHIHTWDLVRYIVSSIYLDMQKARQDQVFLEKAGEIILYRVCQYWGSFLGNHDHRKLSHSQKEEYFYPEEYNNKNEA